MKYIIGIDPGLDGAVAVLEPSSKVHFFDTPTFRITSRKGSRRDYDISGMVLQLRNIHDIAGAFLLAVIELIHAMPKQGVRSMFTMGKGLGIWLGILHSLGIPYSLVAPQTWKARVMRDQGRDKDAARQVAMRLYPDAAVRLARKKDHNRAEALLLAHYGKSGDHF